MQISCAGSTCTCTVPDVGFANALRRALLSDVTTRAPHKVVIHENTTCQSDEYIAHRVGLVPFLPNDARAGKPVMLDVRDTSAYTSHFSQGECTPQHNVCLIEMCAGQHLKLSVEFTDGTGAQHARYSHVSAVAYALQPDGTVRLSFDSITSASPLVYLRAAAESLRSRLTLVSQRAREAKDTGELALTFENEGHTLGCILRQRLFAAGATDASCIVPHPEDDFLRVKICAPNAAQCLAEACAACNAQLDEVIRCIDAHNA